MNEQSEASNGYIAVANDLVKHFQSGPTRVRTVNGVSFRIPSGRIVAVRGPSGCGKSTLLNLIGALDKPDSGELRVDGVDVPRLTGAPEVAYRRRKVGFVFQQFNLIPHLSALENVVLPMELGGDSKRASDEVASALLRQVGLGSLAVPWLGVPTEVTVSGGKPQSLPSTSMMTAWFSGVVTKSSTATVNITVTEVARPAPADASMISTQRATGSLFGEIRSLTPSCSTSAAVPGVDPRPAARRRWKTSEG